MRRKIYFNVYELNKFHRHSFLRKGSIEKPGFEVVPKNKLNEWGGGGKGRGEKQIWVKKGRGCGGQKR